MVRGDPVVSCAGLTKYFGGVRALHSAHLDLHMGEVVGLVGDNGAGKTTLVKVLSGIHRPDSGSITIGATVHDFLTPQIARAVGIDTVYQDLALCDNLSAVENVVLAQEPIRFRFLGLRFIDRSESVKIAKTQLAEVGAAQIDLSLPVRLLSGGQRQAVAIARATTTGHRLIILDEPTAALGVTQTKATLDLVRRVAQSGIAVLMITHNLDQVLEVSDRIVALRHGEITLDRSIGDTRREEVVAAMTGVDLRTGFEG